MSHRLSLCTLLAGAALAGPAHAGDGCRVPASERRATVVELYTSEGCSSCPRADQWLSRLPHAGDVVALAFHVDYWDRLGWVDRFASPAHTERQRTLQHSSGAPFVYTPQVLVNGADWRRWSGPLPADGAPALVGVQLRREGRALTAQVTARDGAGPLPPRLAAYWALVEDGHVSAVRHGENAGATLHHDHVVRQYQPVPAWPATRPQALHFELPAEPGDAGHPQRAVLVVTDAASGRPLQAAELGC